MTSDKKQYSIFSDSPHLTRDELIRYHRRLMADEELHAIEKHLVDCNLCNEALKGIEEMGNAALLYDISRELHRKASRRFLTKKKIFSQLELTAIFAVIFILIFLLLITFFYFSKRNESAVPGIEKKTEQKK